ncbi:MAG: hypothetical protein IPK14_21500 [Blastocatellia bacterium]|nr:hypothetical protein [Blastocatellia bacterium]
MEENKFDTDLEDSDLTGLVSKKEAAKILDVSEKPLQRLSSKDKIITVYKKNIMVVIQPTFHLLS